jgi:hypothetical protein
MVFRTDDQKETKTPNAEDARKAGIQKMDQLASAPGHMSKGDGVLPMQQLVQQSNAGPQSAADTARKKMIERMASQEMPQGHFTKK